MSNQPARQSVPLVYEKKRGGPSLVQVVREAETASTSQTLPQSPSVKPQVRTKPKKVTWIVTPLTIPENNPFLNVLFHRAPMVSAKAAFYLYWSLPLFILGVLGAGVPLVLWGR